jgi:hypothetical protein
MSTCAELMARGADRASADEALTGELMRVVKTSYALQALRERIVEHLHAKDLLDLAGSV